MTIDINVPEVAIGVVAGGLVAPVIGGVVQTASKTLAFDDTRASVESKMNRYLSVGVSEILLNEQLEEESSGDSREEERGSGLLRKAIEGKDKIRKMNVEGPLACLKPLYHDQLIQVGESLDEPLAELQAQTALNVLKTLAGTNKSGKNVKEVLVVTENTNADLKVALPVLMENTEVTKDTSKDVKDIFVATTEIGEFVKGLPHLATDIKNDMAAQIAKLSDTLETRLPTDAVSAVADVKLFMKILERRASEEKDVADQLGSINVSASVGATLIQLNNMVHGTVMNPYFLNPHELLACSLNSIFDLIGRKSGKDKALTSIPLEKLREIQLKLQKGVEVVGNSQKVKVLTKDLMSEYERGFRELEEVLAELYNLLDGINPLKWLKAGKCGGSCRNSTWNNNVDVR